MGCHFFLQSMKVKSESEVAQSCPTLRDPMDCSLPGSSVHGIFQARVLEWGAIAFLQLLSSVQFSSVTQSCPTLCDPIDTTERLPFHFSFSCIGEGNGNLLQCSCLENPRDRGAWWAAVSGVAQNRTGLKRASSSSSNAYFSRAGNEDDI